MVAADDEETQILTAAKDLELEGDGAERHRYLIKRIDGVLERRRHKAPKSRMPHQYKPTIVGDWRRQNSEEPS